MDAHTLPIFVGIDVSKARLDVATSDGQAFAVPNTPEGHAQLVETQNGDWWATFLATRPYRQDFYNTGTQLYTNSAQTGVASITAAAAKNKCWG